MNKQKQKQEAIQRMQILDLFNEAIQEFKEHDVVSISENGTLFWLTDKQKQYVRNFENAYNALVYHVIHNYTEYGEMLSFLFVSKYSNEWNDDKQDLQNNCPMVYVENLDEPMFSEFGSIVIEPHYGGVIRTA